MYYISESKLLFHLLFKNTIFAKTVYMNKLRYNLHIMWSRRQDIGKAFTWLMLLVLFTYTPIISAMLVKDGNALIEYINNQHQAISLFVNLGMLGMVLIDYFGALPSIDGKTTILLSMGVLALFVIYVHSGIIYGGNGYLYRCVINNKWLSIVAHIVFLFIVGKIKYLSLNKTESYIEVSEI